MIDLSTIEPKDQTEEMCMEVIKKNGYALRYVHRQTEAICIEAVKKNGYALQYVHNQTEAICIEAVKQNGDALQYVHNQTEAICLEAVKNDGDAIRFIHDQAILDKIKNPLTERQKRIAELENELAELKKLEDEYNDC